MERGSGKCEKMRGKYGKRDMSKDARDPSFVVRYLTITAHWPHNPPSIMLPHVLQMITYTLAYNRAKTAKNNIGWELYSVHPP